MSSHLKLPGPDNYNLSVTERAWVEEYLRNGLNGTQAYLSIKPKTTYASAASSASEILKKPKVREYLDYRINNKDETANCNPLRIKPYLVEKAKYILENNLDKRPDTALRAISEVAKLEGAYNQDDAPLAEYERFRKQFAVQVNVQVNQGDRASGSEVATTGCEVTAGGCAGDGE